jgi:biotin carboxyl carrier protein
MLIFLEARHRDGKSSGDGDFTRKPRANQPLGLPEVQFTATTKDSPQPTGGRASPEDSALPGEGGFSDKALAMSAPERKYDTRQLDRDRQRYQMIPGALRLDHLSYPAETYILKEWLVQPGEPVEVRQLVAIVETASFTLEIEAYDSGIMAEACVAEGEAIPDGAVIALIVITEEGKR